MQAGCNLCCRFDTIYLCVWQCSWGSKPTPPGTSSGPLALPPPVGPFQGVMASGLNLGYTTNDLLAYQRQVNLTQAGAGRALLPLPHPNLGVGIGQGNPGSRGVYDSFQAGAISGALAQQRMFY